jgi:hypothetical protein
LVAARDTPPRVLSARAPRAYRPGVDQGDPRATLDTARFAMTVERVRAYARAEPGAWGQVADLARLDPEGTTRSLLVLGTVLLDLAAEAFHLGPDEMLTKVAQTVDLHSLGHSCDTDRRDVPR